MSHQEHRRNEEIDAPQIRLIDEEGHMKGIVNLPEALHLAEELGLDLVEIQPNDKPPVCRVMDYGKFRYEQQKKASVAKKHQKQIETKEIHFRPNIETHDYQTKLNHARSFLSEGNKVRLFVKVRARERGQGVYAAALAERLLADLAHDAQLDGNISQTGEGLVFTAAPLPKAPKAKAKALETNEQALVQAHEAVVTKFSP